MTYGTELKLKQQNPGDIAPLELHKDSLRRLGILLTVILLEIVQLCLLFFI